MNGWKSGILCLALFASTASFAGAQERLFPEKRVQPEFKLLNHSFFVNAQYFTRQTGYEALWKRYQGHLPTGKGVVIAQCESGLADPEKLAGTKIIHIPGLTDPKWEAHSGTVATILYGRQPYDDAKAVFERGFSPQAGPVFAYTSNQFREHVLKMEKFNQRGPQLPAWPDPELPVDVLNISNTLGNGGETQNIRALDHLIDATDVLACSAQPGSLKTNASLAGNLWNALVVGKASPDFGYAEGTDHENIDDHRRRKPDLVACSWLNKSGGASSWSTPVVSSAAAMLIERARATPETRRAERNFVLKAILLAGASKSGMFSPVYDDAGKLTDVDENKPWVWSRTDEVPLDKLFGAGSLQIDNSYRILEAGEPAAGVDASATGWLLGERVTSDDPRTVRLVVKEPSQEFSAALVWNRHIGIADGEPYTFSVANLRLELLTADGKLIQTSDDPGNNVEYLWLKDGLQPGTYTLRVTSHGKEAENFGLAWLNGKKDLAP